MEKLPGVTEVLVRFETRHCFVRFDPRKQSAESLVLAVKESGYDAKVDPEAKWPRARRE